VDLVTEEEHGPDDAGVEDERDADVVDERGTDVVDEWGTGVEAHTEDAEEGVRWRADMKEGARWRVDTEEERAPTGVGKW
jgi:hypothetical protein